MSVSVSVCLVLLPDVDLCRPHTVLWKPDEEANTPLLQSDILHSSSPVFLFFFLPLSENTPVFVIIYHYTHTKYTIKSLFILIYIKLI